MDFWQTVLVLLRRWYVVLPAFACTIAAAFGVYAAIPSTYVSQGVLVLTAPLTGSSVSADPEAPAGQINPLLNFEPGLATTASILIQSLNRPDVAARLGVRAEGDTTYRINSGSSNPELLVTGPFLFIEGESNRPDKARQMVERVADQAVRELRARQAILSAPKRTYITVDQVVRATDPLEQQGSPRRAAIAVLGLGGLVSVSAAFATESLAQARRRRQQRRAPGGSPPGSPSTSASPAGAGVRA